MMHSAPPPDEPADHAGDESNRSPPTTSPSRQMLSQLAMLAVAAPSAILFLVLALNTNLPLWALFAIAMVVWIPAAIVAMNLQSDRKLSWRTLWKPRRIDELSERERRNYEDLRHAPLVLGVLLLFLCVTVLYAGLAYLVADLLPAGDAWWVAVIRVLYLLTVLGAGYGLLQWMLKQTRELVRRRFSSRTAEVLFGSESDPPSRPWPRELLRNWQYLAVAIICLLLLTGTIDLESPVFEVRDARKLRGVLLLAQWAQAHPNTVWLSSAMLGAFSLGCYGFRVAAAYQSRTTRPADDDPGSRKAT